MSDEQVGGDEAEDAFMTELYLRLEERAAARYSDSYDAAAASAWYQAWLNPKRLTLPRNCKPSANHPVVLKSGASGGCQAMLQTPFSERP